MTDQDHIEIPLSRTKMILMFLGSLIFVGLGIWFLVHPPNVRNPIFGNSIFVFIIGIAAILFFGAIAISVFRKFSDKKAGLIINQQGIIDNSSGVSAGLIPWGDIEDIRISQVMSQKFLMVIVRNPQDYLNKASNRMKRNAMNMNYK